MDRDLLGNPTTDVEKEVVRLYGALKALVAREDTPPCVQRNVTKALACLWQACNDLDLSHEQLYDHGV